jgi:hypothetical protein
MMTEESKSSTTCCLLLPHGQATTVTMSNESRMIELEAGQTDTAERFDMAERQFDSIDAGMGRMEAMMEAFLTKNAEDAATYATIAALQQEVTQDKMDLAALTSLSSPSFTGLACQLRSLAGNIANTLANSGVRTLKDLGAEVRQFQGKGSAFAPPALSYSPNLPANVTKRNSTGNPSTRPGMPICHVTADSDASSNVSESDSSIFRTQEHLDNLESLMKNVNDEVDIEMDDMAQDSDLGAEAEMSPPSSPLTMGNNIDSHSVLSVSQLGIQLDTAQIVQLDQDLTTIRNRIAVLEDPSISTKPDSIKQLYKMIEGMAA